MNHAEYRALFPQYAGLPEDGVVYGPHPGHSNWRKPQWNASQMLPDQNRKHNPSPRWTNTNMVGDLGPYGRYQEAKQIAGREARANTERQLRFPQLTGIVLKELRGDALRDTENSVFVDAGAAIVGMIGGLGVIGGVVYGLSTQDPWHGMALFDLVAVGAMGAGGLADAVRRRRRDGLMVDEAIAQ